MLCDPYFELVPRPLDSAWQHAGITGFVGGFNPTLHRYFYPSSSRLSGWLEGGGVAPRSAVEEAELGAEVLHLAHDYLHSWSFRAISHLEPGLVPRLPRDLDELELQAWLLVLTEAVAVVGLDYWYLCVRDAGARCGASVTLGPRTVHYSEAQLPLYREHNPRLVVQRPEHLIEVTRLYALGVVSGFDESDLLACRPLADWLVRELLIAPRQREVARNWLSRLSGVELPDVDPSLPFRLPAGLQEAVVPSLSQLLWRKVKHGATLFFPHPPVTRPWRYATDAPFDFRFTNAACAEAAAWASEAPKFEESWRYYVDQVVAAHHMPTEDIEREDIRVLIEGARAAHDPDALLLLKQRLRPVAGVDDAPLELLFVN